ncbi:MAG: hypothetical protein DIU79_09525 [Actinobacteria bacterium]|nr:MAG: hypothetical protein DIU79_09525 [Actinomycetota bacterium]
MSNGTRRPFGEGPLAQVVSLIYTLLVLEALLVLTVLPGLLPLILLDRDASNIPLFVACVLPLGPAVSAAVFAWHRFRADLTDLTPARAFWRGYRMNFWGVLRIWVPLLLWLVVIMLNLANFDAAGVPGWWAGLLVAIGAAATLWGINALVISSLFVFRVRDIARLAAYFLLRTPSVTVGNALLLLAAAAVTALSSEAVLALLGSMMSLALLLVSRPMINKIREEFTA